ncbi:polysaccharide lyase beta-sandwich domain-containing protein [Terrimonas sp. NA20]|uniref:Polysaccharide lyase beta-sandwich domain-containing protein n=1 Tax=Terrimonas ginsenosidimutans TaxID=2908004 RepID=A0ABS9KW25_9BACT|nr:polysaccharide lyase family 8 super-sandwich domain-containing protein [Terrimonas ginsenosidimutans]MCG2616536.1 polysaccharide lyase beta-sandwich domain-containing protein [Terrimonas ginsenosidimutans]
MTGKTNSIYSPAGNGLKAFLMACLLFVAIAGQAQQPDADTIINRLARHLIQRSSLPGIEKFAFNLNSANQWEDIDYSDLAKSKWKTAIHLDRVKELAIAWATPSSKYYKDARVWNTLSKALDVWLGKKFQNPNWWHNEIGIPQIMRSILAVAGNQLTGTQRQGGLQVLAQYRVRGTGANLIWSADLAMHYGAFIKNDSIIKNSRRLIVAEIRNDTAEGIQPDYSFYQHGARLQSFHYGIDYLNDLLRIGWQLQGTVWAYPADKAALLTNYVMHGWQWMSRNNYTTPATVDRAVSRKGQLKGISMQYVAGFLSGLDPSRAASIDRMEQEYRLNTRKPAFHDFPYSDFATYHQPGFSVFIKTISTRTLPTESINSENKKGQLLHAGNVYLVKDGKEYFDVMPLWDWQYLPGITSFDPQAKIERMDFAGTVTDGESGLTAMHYALRKDSSLLTARKAWIMRGDQMIALIAGLTRRNISTPVYTVLDQSRWREPVLAGNRKISKPGVHPFSAKEHLYHNGFSFSLLTTGDGKLILRDTTGSWRSINEGEQPTEVKGKIFQPMIEHKNDDAAAYLVSFYSSPGEIKAAGSQQWNIIRNDTACQAILFDDGMVMAVFHKAGSLKVTEETTIQVDRPCLLQYHSNKLTLSDPLQLGGTLKLSIGARQLSADLKKDGSSLSINL